MTNSDTFFAQKDELDICDFNNVPLIVLDPQKSPEEYRKILNEVLEGRSPVDIYFCDTVESAVTLAQAGYGVAMLPDFFPGRNPTLRHLPIKDTVPISYGIYYKTLTGCPVRKTFVKSAKEHFANCL